ncbi:anthrone oxygenase family protein [Algiphilus aromaticivorans]|jgi:uncharacterized membrane protein|uniref:anthrone oxygenase family protein n=1 Tax=Algiphilus aromaticivorans TaxID=382454 RepID=UPI000ADEBD0F|nr:anthrone oxygenase family protein [Algiphilus aromaticivorans]
MLSLLLCLGAATVGGVFFAFSSFVMRALGQLPPEAGVAAMQRINVVVLNAWFLGAFLGTALLASLAAVTALQVLPAPEAAQLLVAALLYLVGPLAVTMRCNVPRNERLARMEAASAEAAQYWPLYKREWTRWNHVRTVASLASATCAAGALIA